MALFSLQIKTIENWIILVHGNSLEVLFVQGCLEVQEAPEDPKKKENTKIKNWDVEIWHSIDFNSFL